MRFGVKCKACNQLDHVEKVCKNKIKRHGQQVPIVKHQELIEAKLFVASCYSASNNREV